MSAIDEFCDQHFAREQISEKRQRRVRRLLLALDTLYAPKTLLDWTHEEMRRWTTDRRGEVAANTVRFEMMMVRPFFHWAWQHDRLDLDTYHRLIAVDPPRGATSRSTPKPYSRSEIQDFWRDLDAQFGAVPEHFIGRFKRGTSRYPRVRQHARRLQAEAIAGLALYCALRGHEIYALGMDDLHPDNEYLPIAGKRDPTTGLVKYRQVPYSDAARRRVAAWLAFRRLLRPPHRSVWLGLHWSEPTSAMAKRTFEGLFSGIGRGWELHRLRHTCATERRRNGMPLDALKEYMGHATIEQTLAYAKIVEADVQLAAEATDAAIEDALEPIERSAA